jgi:hypothetical protein
LPGIGPGRTPGHEIELLQNVAHNLVRLILFTQLIELGHHLCKGTFDVADSSFRVELALRVETTLTTYELFSVKI